MYTATALEQHLTATFKGKVVLYRDVAADQRVHHYFAILEIVHFHFDITEHIPIYRPEPEKILLRITERNILVKSKQEIGLQRRGILVMHQTVDNNLEIIGIVRRLQ